MARQRVEEILSSFWPSEDLEAVSSCPACLSGRRELLYERLWDNSALTAPGRWSLWRCGNCRSAYLDPRPTPASIGRAYEDYYTHRASGEPIPDPRTSGLGLLRLKLGNGYRNWRYGTNSEPSTKFGVVLGVLLPRFRSGSDFHYRYLPKTTSNPPKVLDVGCGGGQWLSRIADTGWQRFGADPDPRAAAVARGRDIEVRDGGIEVWRDACGGFDALTMSHVIEHVHDPRRVLSEARDLLRPGGQLFVQTPNIDALGHSFFGRTWRGLESPRHLVLFNLRSLTLLLKEVGFERIRVRPAPSELDFIFAVSRDLASIEPDPSDVLGRSKFDEHWTRFRSKFTRSRCEFLTLTCSRGR